MPISPLEAMSVGLPQIITLIPGVTDLANIEGETGYYIPQGDLGALKDAMIRLGSNESLRHRMGQRATEVIREGFAWEQHVTNWMKLYEGDAVTERRSHDPASTLKS
jgi:glycosyltransferase involved in cell wall biosynthesis